MTNNIIRCAVLLFIALSATQVAAKPTAYLRDDGTNFYVAIKTDPRLWNGRDAAEMQVATTDDILKRVIAAVFLEGRLVATAVSPSDGMDSDFIIVLPNGTVPSDDIPSLLVAVQSYPTGPTQTSGFSAAVTNEMTASINMRSGFCDTGFPLVIEFTDKAVETTYGRRRIGILHGYMSTDYPTVRVESATAATDEVRQIRRPAGFFGNPLTDKLVLPMLRTNRSTSSRHL